jgi:hypothetical protein
MDEEIFRCGSAGALPCGRGGNRLLCGEELLGEPSTGIVGCRGGRGGR